MGFGMGMMNAVGRGLGVAQGAAGYLKGGFFSRSMGRRAAVGGIMGGVTGGYVGADNGFGGFMGGAVAGAAAGAGMMVGQRRMLANSMRRGRAMFGNAIPGRALLQANRQGFAVAGALATAAASQIGSSVLATNGG